LSGQFHIRWIAVIAILVVSVLTLTTHAVECKQLAHDVAASARGNAQDVGTSVAAPYGSATQAHKTAGNTPPDSAAIVLISAVLAIVLPELLSVSGEFEAPLANESANSSLAHKAISVLLI